MTGSAWPIVVLLLGLAVGTQLEHGPMIHAVKIVVEELGIELVVGLVLTWLAVRMLRFAQGEGWISEHWEEVPIVALAAACFAAAQTIGGSGFIACFVGGLLLSGLRPAHKKKRLSGAVATGEALALLTWIAFGVGTLAPIIARLSWQGLTYAVLSLTVIRMVPVLLCLAGTGMRIADKLFVAWFGPRGLATIVFGVIVFNEKLPGNDTIIAVAGATVLLRVIAHGISANPLVKAISGGSTKRPPGMPRDQRLRAELHHHTVGAEAQRQTLTLGVQLQIDAVRILQPHPALALLADRPAGTGLTVDAIEVFMAA